MNYKVIKKPKGKLPKDVGIFNTAVVTKNDGSEYEIVINSFSRREVSDEEAIRELNINNLWHNEDCFKKMKYAYLRVVDIPTIQNKKNEKDTINLICKLKMENGMAEIEKLMLVNLDEAQEMWDNGNHMEAQRFLCKHNPDFDDLNTMSAVRILDRGIAASIKKEAEIKELFTALVSIIPDDLEILGRVGLLEVLHSIQAFVESYKK